MTRTRMQVPDELDVLAFQPWRDPVVEAFGHAVTGHYAETYWLPTIGPSALLVARRLTVWGTGTVNLGELGKALGLRGEGRHAPLRRTLRRLVDFDLARYNGVALEVRTHVAPLTRHQLSRLPLWLQSAHDHQGAA